jgi:hypothetical protein
MNMITISDEYRERMTLAADLTVAARQLDAPPQYEFKKRSRRGEELSKPIHWQGRQWAVTAYGIECLDGNYPIEADRLWEEDDSYSWVQHMAGKEWVDLPDFAEALRIARRRDAMRKKPKSRKLG